MSARRNTLYNLAGAALPIAVSFLTVPAYLSRIGDARFGILSVAWLLLGYFGILDLGLGMATAQQVAAREKEGRATQARIFWTALLTNASLGIAGGLVAWPIAQLYFGHALKVTGDIRGETMVALPWLIVAVPLAMVAGVLTGTLQGLHRFASLNAISFIGTVIFQVLPLAAAAFWSPSLTVVLPIAIGARALTVVLLWFECHRHLLRGYPVAYHRSELRSLLRFGFWITVSVLFVPVMSLIDRFVIGAFISAAAVSAYVIPYNLAERVCILGNSAGAALFPRFSSLSKQQTIELAYRSERTLLAIMVIASVAAIYLVRPFITIWISPGFANKSSHAAEILMAGIWLESLSRIPLHALRGQFRPAAVARIDLTVMIPFWLVLYMLIRTNGIEGVAAAYVFRVGVTYLLLASAIGTLARMLRMVMLTAALVLASVVAARLLHPLSVGWDLAFIGSIAIGLLLAFRFLPPSQREELVGRLHATLVSIRARRRAQ
ncbi:MAG TPA: oligosaccharide flippase family protein [Bradyrhizobium sp.]|uniref:oligosaccharide flippase family protein n=1 Tax=Bradyrhizobium sp. TaxID=376 RepID=UPI002B47FF0E|nr:oligosaccharide flippase family protein [Bradyrhizobium sp.]HKO70750.1 oligosaccharide flippase family protein [Bradyrhizobium sp.]